MAYTTQAKIENMFGMTMTAAMAAACADVISAVKVWIDRYCGKTFEASSQARYYDWDGGRRIEVDSFVGSAIVEILNPDGTTSRTLTVGADHDYIVEPYNNASDGSAEKTSIFLTNSGWSGTGWWYSGLPSGKRSVRVTATFGFSTSVPADVQFAATKLAGTLLQDVNEGVITQIRLGDYQATYAAMDEESDAMGISNILDQYRDIDI